MGKRSSVRSRPWAGAALCLLIVLGLLLAACDPSDFDALTRKRDAAAGAEAGRGAERDAGGAGGAGESGRDAGLEGGAGAAASMDAGPSPPGDAGLDAAADGGDATTEAGSPECPRASDPDAVSVRATELGVMQVLGVGPPGVAMTARVGPHMLWVFGHSDPDIDAWAAWSGVTPPASPPELEVPLPIGPLFPADAVPANRTPLLTGVVTVSDSEALIYFGSGLLFNTDDIGVVRIRFDEPEASVVRQAGMLFPYRQTTPRIWIPLFGTGTFAHEEPDGTYIYLYACNANPDAPDEQQGGVHESPCRVARVLRELAGDGTKYRYWNGSEWVSDYRAASIVMDHVPQLLTVSFNRYLQKFLAVHSHGLLDRIIFRWADRPEGPWHVLDEYETLDATGEFPFTVVGAVEHPGLRDPCAQTIYASYILPLLVTGPQGNQTVLEHHMLEIVLD